MPEPVSMKQSFVAQMFAQIWTNFSFIETLIFLIITALFLSTDNYHIVLKLLLTTSIHIPVPPNAISHTLLLLSIIAAQFSSIFFWISISLSFSILNQYPISTLTKSNLILPLRLLCFTQATFVNQRYSPLESYALPFINSLQGIANFSLVFIQTIQAVSIAPQYFKEIAFFVLLCFSITRLVILDVSSQDQYYPFLRFLIDLIITNRIIVLLEIIFLPILLIIGFKIALVPPKDPNINGACGLDKLRYIAGRKFFHLIVVLASAPQLISPDAFLFLGLVWGLCIYAYILIEAARVCNVRKFGTWLNSYIYGVTDTRDREGVILTPLFLSLGVAVTIWIEIAITIHKGKSAQIDLLRGALGLIATGVADAIAGVIGVGASVLSLNRTLPLNESGRTMFGSAGYFGGFWLSTYAIARSLNLSFVCLHVTKTAGVAMLMEGYSEGIDNLIVALVTFATYYFC